MMLRREILKFAAMMCVGFGFAMSQAAMAAEQVDPKRPLKVALVLPGSVSDGTFNAAAAKGIKEAQAKYPNVTVSVRENTGMAQIEAALFEYASNGYDVVIGHGFQFAEAAKKIHNQFPKTWFIVNTAKVSEAPNLASFDNRWGDAGYVAGALAGLLTKSGTVGAVGGIPVPVIQEYNEGFERGAKRGACAINEARRVIKEIEIERIRMIDHSPNCFPIPFPKTTELSRTPGVG